jgi:large subunit ribosomal protein L5
MNRLKQRYQEEIAKTLKDELQVKNAMALPKVTKIVINMGIGEAKDNEGILEKAKINIEALAGQKPVVTRAKMYAFLDKLISIVLPKVRDFRGVPLASFDKSGNYNLGLREQIIFPEVDYKNIDKPRGMQITITTTAKNKEEGKRLLELLGMPFQKVN